MTVVVVECGYIDPSASKLSLLTKPTIHRCISSIQGVFVGLLVSWTRDVTYGRCGRTYWCSRAKPWPAAADSVQLRSDVVRPSLAMCSRT
jgi:hypothetical protein